MCSEEKRYILSHLSRFLPLCFVLCVITLCPDMQRDCIFPVITNLLINCKNKVVDSQITNKLFCYFLMSTTLIVFQNQLKSNVVVFFSYLRKNSLTCVYMSYTYSQKCDLNKQNPMISFILILEIKGKSRDERL